MLHQVSLCLFSCMLLPGLQASPSKAPNIILSWRLRLEMSMRCLTISTISRKSFKMKSLRKKICFSASLPSSFFYLNFFEFLNSLDIFHEENWIFPVKAGSKLILINKVLNYISFLKNPADMNVQNGKGWTVLMYPSFEGKRN